MNTYRATPHLIGSAYIALLFSAKGTSLEKTYHPIRPVTEIVASIVAIFGEIQSIRNSDMDIASECGAILWVVGRRHPFPNGNKRTAALSAQLTAKKNGMAFRRPYPELLTVLRSVASGTATVGEVIALMESNLIPSPATAPPESDGLFERITSVTSAD